MMRRHRSADGPTLGSLGPDHVCGAPLTGSAT